MLLQIGLMPAQLSPMVASFGTLFIMLDGSKERVIYEHHFSGAVSECLSLVSDENKGWPTHRPEGDEVRGLH